MTEAPLQRLSCAPSISRYARAIAVAPCVAAVVGACAARVPTGGIQPGVEQQTIATAQPSANRFILFDWTLREGQSRFSGAGAARITSDQRARLDLFGPQDVPYLSAILRQERLTLPPGVPERVVPPAPLLWSAFGVIRPPEGAELTVAETSGAETTLVYTAPSGTWVFTAREGVLVGAEWRAAGGARHTVELTGAVPGAPPQRALYRDWQEYRELVLELEQQEEVDAFPPETWSLEPR